MSARKYILIEYSDLAKEYIMEKNKVPVEEIYVSYPLAVWWRCEKGHEWLAMVSDRVGSHGCIFCARQAPIVGETDLATTHPLVSKEWHPTMNGALIPQSVMHGSTKKVWWICERHHEWPATIGSRTCDSGASCPYCSGRLAIQGENDFETLHPDMAKEWHPYKNEKLKPYEFKEKSNKKIWWMCSEGHEWEDRICERVIHNKKCPNCNRTRTTVIPGTNSFKALEPEAAMFWDYEKNGDCKPENFLPHSNKELNWTCGEHDWFEAIDLMTNRKACPYCSGVRLLKENSAFSRHPRLLIDYDYDKNIGIDIDTISEGSSKQLWWKCHKGHNWLAPTERRVKGSNCPICNDKRSIYSV